MRPLHVFLPSDEDDDDATSALKKREEERPWVTPSLEEKAKQTAAAARTAQAMADAIDVKNGKPTSGGIAGALAQQKVSFQIIRNART